MPFVSFEDHCKFFLARRLGSVTGANFATSLDPLSYLDDPMDVDATGEMGDSFEDDPMNIEDPFMGNYFEDDPIDMDPRCLRSLVRLGLIDPFPAHINLSG
ncbi:unnamed protein product [Rhizopus stolonifer]